uniref:Uncharacterized protein n=1 Tax=Tetranychus urticae TaxID=32264 RepID=T1JWA2_TETUR
MSLDICVYSIHNNPFTWTTLVKLFYEIVRSTVSKQTFQCYPFLGNSLELLKISRIFSHFHHLIF